MSAPDYQLLIKQILKMPLAQASRKQVVYRGELRFSYPQFAERVARLAGALTKLGAKFGTRIGVMDWDSHRYLESYFAIPMMGATLMMVNIRLSPEQIAYTIDHADVECLLLNKDFLPVLEQIHEKLPKLKQIILLTDDGIKVEGPFVGEYEELLAAADKNFDFPDFDENTIATTFYTTGTTGNPKGVYFSHRQLVLHTMMIMSSIAMSGTNGRISREDVYMPLTPMFHVHAWGFPFVAVAMGMQQVYAGRFLPPVVLKLLATEGVTFSHCVPTIMHMILSAPEADSINLSGWKVIIGGSALPRAMAAAGLKRGIDIFTGYGMSETCPLLTLSYLKHDLIKDATLETEIDLRTASGLPSLFVELDIVDEDMNPQPRDGHCVGEVVTRGPALTAGYAKNPEATAALWKGGWLHTGDIGAIDENGYLRVLDRSKDVIKTGGEWISSIGLEDIILRHPAISECAVIGIEDHRWGERPIAVVVLKPDATATEEEIKNLVRARTETGELSKFAIPDHIIFAQSLEKTSVGKLDKKKMRAIYGTVKAA